MVQGGCIETTDMQAYFIGQIQGHRLKHAWYKQTTLKIHAKMERTRSELK
jgi:hypothetical protein